MKPNAIRFGLVKEVRIGGFLNVSSQPFPCIALRKNVMGKAFRYETLIIFLGDTKDNFHGIDSTPSFSGSK
jgi:hypothetical protein